MSDILRRTASPAIMAVITAVSVLAVCACSKASGTYGTEDDGDFINFYIKGTSTKAIIDNTDDLVSQRQEIVVTDEATNPVFSETPIPHFQNNIWRSDKTWTAGKTYSLFAYIASDNPDKGSAVSVRNAGRDITIIQPTYYSDDQTIWADYLLSYRVSANGSDKPLVQLEFEHATTAVELYMTKGPNMYDVIVDEVVFRNVATNARLRLREHGVLNVDNADPVTGMKNKWSVTVDGGDYAAYSYRISSGLPLEAFDGTSDRFDEKYRLIRFLTVPQTPLSGNTKTEISISYRVRESEEDSYREESSTFELAQYSPKEWMIGHKVRYYVNIDSSTELTGVIDEWKYVDFIEGVLLPE